MCLHVFVFAVGHVQATIGCVDKKTQKKCFVFCFWRGSGEVGTGGTRADPAYLFRARILPNNGWLFCRPAEEGSEKKKYCFFEDKLLHYAKAGTAQLTVRPDTREILVSFLRKLDRTDFSHMYTIWLTDLSLKNGVPTQWRAVSAWSIDLIDGVMDRLIDCLIGWLNTSR